jgi:hypothetical protein
MNWQPIATAPKDGTAILVHDKTHGMVTAFCDKDGQWISVFGGDYSEDDRVHFITHWMPLPELPR